MSYSVCISCESMVPTYEKYCASCLKQWPNLNQVEDFWKHYFYTWDAAREMAKAEKENQPPKITDIDKALVELWAKYAITPTHLQTSLGNFRKLCAEHGPLQHAIDFLKETAEVSGDAIVVMTPGKLALLTDDKGQLLEFS